MAVRCIFAHPGGLEIDLVLRAVGVQAEAAARQTFHEHVQKAETLDATKPVWRGPSEAVLLVEVDGRRATAYPHEQSSSGGEDQFDSELRVAIDALPSDGLIKITASWPQAGLAEGSVTVNLESLDNLGSRVVRMPS